jgi:tetratricopeptide (TPR) repeat protein
MRMLVKVLAASAAFACVCGAPSAIASGSGGGSDMGGGVPSSSQNEDPAQAYQAGVAALNAHNYREAIRNFRSARRSLPNDGNVNYALGLAFVGNGDKNGARSAFQRATNATNAPVGAYLQLGLLYIDLDQHDNAIAEQTTLANLIAACDDSCGDARRTQLQAAHDQLTQALEPAAPAADPATTGWNFPSVEEGRAAYADAIGLINQERFADALDALHRAASAVGPQPDVLNYMGFASRKLGRYDVALAYYREALTIDPHHLGATEYLGELYIQMGDMAHARTQLAQLDTLCAYGCAQREELARWIERASG